MDPEPLVRPLPDAGQERVRWFTELADALRQDAERTRLQLRVEGVSYIAGIPFEDLYNPMTQTLAYSGKDPSPTVQTGKDRSEEVVSDIVESFEAHVVSVVTGALEQERIEDAWKGRPQATIGGRHYHDTTDALWGQFFWGIGWTNDYHPPSAGQTHGRFAIHGAAPLLVEVGIDDLEARVEEVEARPPSPDWHHDLLLLSNDILVPNLRVEWPQTAIAAGYLGEHWCDHPSPGRCTIALAPTGWVSCTSCGVAVHHPEQSFRTRPCGCYDAGGNVDAPDRQLLRDAWERALDAVRTAANL